MGIKLPPLKVSISYYYNAVLRLVFVFNLANIFDHTVCKLKTFDLTASNSSVNTSVLSASWHGS